MATSVGEQLQRSLMHDAIIDIVLADLIRQNLGGLDYIPKLRAQAESIIGEGQHRDAMAAFVAKMVGDIETRVRG